MILFLLSEIQPCITESDIGEIIFKRCLNIPPALYVISASFLQNESIYETIQITADCIRIDLYMLDAMESI